MEEEEYTRNKNTENEALRQEHFVPVLKSRYSRYFSSDATSNKYQRGFLCFLLYCNYLQIVSSYV